MYLTALFWSLLPAWLLTSYLSSMGLKVNVLNHYTGHSLIRRPKKVAWYFSTASKKQLIFESPLGLAKEMVCTLLRPHSSSLFLQRWMNIVCFEVCYTWKTVAPVILIGEQQQTWKKHLKLINSISWVVCLKAHNNRNNIAINILSMRSLSLKWLYTSPPRPQASWLLSWPSTRPS